MKIQHLGQEKTELYKKSELYGYLAIAPNNYKNFANEKFVQVNKLHLSIILALI